MPATLFPLCLNLDRPLFDRAKRDGVIRSIGEEMNEAVGGLLFDGGGYRSTFVASAAALLGSALLSAITSRASAEPTV